MDVYFLFQASRQQRMLDRFIMASLLYKWLEFVMFMGMENITFSLYFFGEKTKAKNISGGYVFL